MQYLFKVYQDGYASGLYRPTDVMMTPGVSGFDVLVSAPETGKGDFNTAPKVIKQQRYTIQGWDLKFSANKREFGQGVLVQIYI